MNNSLINLLQDTKAFLQVNTLKNNTRHLGVLNIEDNLKAIYALMMHKDNSLILCENELSATKIVELINNLEDNKAVLFPSEPSHFYFADFHSRDITHERIKALHNLIYKKGIILVSSFESALKKIMPVDKYKKFYISISIDTIIPMENLIEKLILSGYERTDQVEGKGQFSVKGGIIDLYNVIDENPVRIEFFDDEIDSLRFFDVESQISINMVDSIIISPTREVLFFQNDLEKIRKKVENQIQLLDVKDDTAKQYAAMLDGYIQGTNYRHEDLILFYNGQLCSVIDYFNEKNMFILDQSDRYKDKYDIYIDQMKEDYNALLEKGEVIKSFFNRFYTFDDIRDKIETHETLEFNNFNTQKRFLKKTSFIDVQSKQIFKFYGRIPSFIDQIIQWIKEEYTIVILARDVQHSITLKEMFFNYNINALSNQSEIVTKRVNIVISGMTQGFLLYGDKIAVLSEMDIFNIKDKEKKSKAKINKGKKIESFTQLNIGDYIVHDVHGIGVYMGIEQISVEGIKKDYLHLRYAKGDKLYIPIDQMESVQVYIGLGDKQPKISKLGSGDWKKAKQTTKASIMDMADDLIKIYAQRRQIKGFAFSKDSQWIREFEEKFPYEETMDQLQSISEVKQDMERNIPMDRLLCGDVGYGKTEVAIRAAFKCIMDNKQVAVLVPTTILAQQHYNSFIQRFGDYPIKIEMLSRFRTKKQQDEIVKDLKKNQVDIIIGTHRILSKDVLFNDLGLLIIDEEQRFGVRHKEKIKQLKNSVDVLTLSATPIPRTLHMSLMGARDMSILNEPPHNRTPVQTYVMEYNDIFVRDAIYKELGRNGQIYYVYNRVNNIESVINKVERMVPEAKIALAHGQMSEVQLEKVMIDFMNHEYDILVCTTIIESGLDIPNVNTIIIEDADQMGLSQLYQLRGRVGRSDRLAYSYITYRKDKILSEIAQKRLRAIKDFTEFGSGFKIAMRDLEIRGAGNLLGSKQHGHLVTVGYDMYCKLLDEAVKELKGEKVPEETNTLIELDVDGYIPAKYIDNEKQKYELYKKMIHVDTLEDLYTLEEEIEDRYGDLPKSVMNLLMICYIKNMASSLNMNKLKNQGNKVFFIFDNKNMLAPELLKDIIKVYNVQFNSDGVKDTVIEIICTDAKDNILNIIKDILEKIISTKKTTS